MTSRCQTEKQGNLIINEPKYRLSHKPAYWWGASYGVWGFGYGEYSGGGFWVYGGGSWEYGGGGS
ncbi:hypothetical protein [Salinisphaera sp. G21_0]|uniref:hypothetical protein n=1 Tax=Salinisphaera sp. G21_0 TaxID=2821094 RepID=UPI001ADA3A56|nr:hypothetical protein [Salinisphaera sp. G21_0]MBO9484196.1 hypothetical protein [Salinisphaera sp. G21_0]